ncbi:phosphate:acyl-[acyl carrier protein] acyltransferase [Abditibacterium utsteinense]|uniref:Phosphate acyltransferase n=1 Tax=Abditibacterium utsteinense TaxID=1960156 RepID=A0A2S8SVF7_9BACT|nr:phosphate acyltransferase PlsX [Abditibacterium utsteinense]PQV64777.1 phosphate:acyl-[acyl carrier protein] acyltransferase [Abditibacterium utsteinense]
MRIAIDAMGGDNAPRELVLGAVAAAERDASIHIILVGDESQIRPFLPPSAPSNISLHPATQVVAMDEPPSSALRNKKDSGVAVATRLLKEGAVDACLSAGNTGAASAFALFTLGRIAGIDRPGIATIFPTAQHPLVLLDSGANVDCRPRHLADFAIMGAAYAPVIHSIIPGKRSGVSRGEMPRVGLLSIGEEESKGNELTKAAFPLIKEGAARGHYNFVGNVEGRDIGAGTVDIVVCDGFAGNITLKLAESYVAMFNSLLKDAFLSSPQSKIGALLLKPALKAMKARLDHKAWGGAVLLGVNGTCIICHGSADAYAISGAIRVAKETVNTDVAGKIRAAIAARPPLETLGNSVSK